MIRPQSLPGAMISFYRKETESYFERLNDLSSLLSPVHLWWKLPLLLPRERTHQLSPLSVSALPFQELLPQWLQTCNKPPSISRNALYWLIFSPFFSDLFLAWFSSHFCLSFPYFYPGDAGDVAPGHLPSWVTACTPKPWIIFSNSVNI